LKKLAWGVFTRKSRNQPWRPIDYYWPTTGYVEAVAEEIRNNEGKSVTKASRGKPLRYEWLKRYVRPTNSTKLYLLMFKLIHYRNRCIGCNACVEIAYQRWRMSKKDGKAVLLGAIEKKGFIKFNLTRTNSPRMNKR
jgi:ferredoxin